MESQQNNIALYAAIKTFHTEGNDIWATVSALTLLTIDNSATIEETKRSFNNFYEIEIPTETLKTVLARLKREGLIDDTKLSIELTDAGVSRKEALEESVKNIRKEYGLLHKDFEQYLGQQKITGITNVESALLSFIDDNIGFASEIIVSESKQKTRTIPASAIAQYILHIAEDDTKLFEIFQNIFFGRLYLTLMKTRTELDAKAKFDKLTVLLDTNVLLSLLGLHEESRELTANELIHILQSYKDSITVGVLDITVDESVSVLHAYSQDNTEYNKHIRVDSDAFRMRLKKISKTDLDLLIENFEEKINDLGVTIITSQSIDEVRMQETYSEISKLSNEIDQQKNDKALKHDALVIENMRILRSGIRSRLLEKSKVVFVTQDRSLVGYAKEISAYNHRFLLAIRPVDIMSLLWVKSLGSDEHNVTGTFLRHAVMGYARERLIDNDLWNSFVQKMEEARQKGTISDSDINFIMASDETERLLSTNDKKVVNSIINQKYIDKLRDEHAGLIATNQKNTSQIKRLGTELTETQERTKSIQLKNEIVSSRFKYIAERLSNIIIAVLGLVLTVAIAAAIYYLIILIGLDGLVGWIAVVIYILTLGAASVLGKELKPTKIVLGIRIYMRNKLERFFYNSLHKFFIGPLESPNSEK